MTTPKPTSATADARTFETYADIIAIWENDGDLALALAVSRTHASAIRARGRIPRSKWRLAQESAAAAGHPLPPGALEQAEMGLQDAVAREKVEPSLPLPGGA